MTTQHKELPKILNSQKVFDGRVFKVTVDTVEAGFMTKDLALLVGPDQKWLSTTGFLDKVDENLKKAMGV